MRFLSDSQACLAWCLQLASNGTSRVLATWHLEDDSDELVPAGGRVHVVAPSFESFVYRFWLENLLWFKLTRKELLAPAEQVYVAAAKRASSLVVAPDDDE